MKKLALLFVLVICAFGYAHDLHPGQFPLHSWSNSKNQVVAEGTFYMLKNNCVYVEDAHLKIVQIPFQSLSTKDQDYALAKNQRVVDLNQSPFDEKKSEVNTEIIFNSEEIKFIGFFGVAFIFCLMFFMHQKNVRYLIPLMIAALVTLTYGFTGQLTATDPDFVQSAFAPFSSSVSTSYDNTYFYIHSKGIPNHTMMVGISNHGWQQQVPIPQCYINDNAWSIPLNPVMAATPIPIDAVHFTRGAIAIAANGVPIFNYHTNTGVDSYLDGQLDNYGGHCGRGDDYHYHIAPLHLYSLGQTTTNLPCAFSFDGFAVYGSLEPDGSPMTTLDDNHGHLGTDGVYHYHGTNAAPYMIGNFVGQVTEDATHQLIPQAAAHPVRNENWTPLSGALITSCTTNANNNGYNLSYSLNGTPGYATNFSWNGTTYTFNYVTPTGTTNTNYNGFSQCSVPNLAQATFDQNKGIYLVPNPAKNFVQIRLKDESLSQKNQKISIYNAQGKKMYGANQFQSQINVQGWPSGVYWVKIVGSDTSITQKLIVE
ncbi:MAG: T9SS type A sorting domain-containing protein [Flavobacteriaceae bacterium]